MDIAYQYSRTSLCTYNPVGPPYFNFLYRVEHKLEPVRFYGSKQYLIKIRTRTPIRRSGLVKLVTGSSVAITILMVMREGKLLFRTLPIYKLITRKGFV